jgi:capsid portal protein
VIRLINERDDIHAPFTAEKCIEMQIDSEATLEEMLDAYRHFLLASGYQIDGRLDVVDND